jgi:hypothetical protein
MLYTKIIQQNFLSVVDGRAALNLRMSRADFFSKEAETLCGR